MAPPLGDTAALAPSEAPAINGNAKTTNGNTAAKAAAATAPFPSVRRHNPRSDRFPVRRFHHVEFWTADATTAARRFAAGLGMTLVAKSDQSTGNPTFASYALRSGELVLAFTAPYSRRAVALAAEAASKTGSAPAAAPRVPLPSYSQQDALDFVAAHGLAVRALAVEVDDARSAFDASVAGGAVAVLPPTVLQPWVDDGDDNNKSSALSSHTPQTVAEVKLYGDVVLRYVSGPPSSAVPFLAGYQPVPAGNAPFKLDYGLERLDHAVGNVPNLSEAQRYIQAFTGFHEFAEFTAEDVGTVDSGLNSVVLANNNENVLLPVNEPTFGTRRKSQIQTYLEQNEGAGLQHLALKTQDIFSTLRAMRAAADAGAGLEFMPRPSDAYYKGLKEKLTAGGVVACPLSDADLKACEELGVLVDRDDQGTLLQIFTKPLGDRPTVFVEIIQRVGCMRPVGGGGDGEADGSAAAEAEAAAAEEAAAAKARAEAKAEQVRMEQAGGCGGFGKGNFSELFKSIEDYERTLDV
jgi:4-hydroxyphenylpyruvate dioxygenase